MDILKRIGLRLTYNAYDRSDHLKFLVGRASDEHAFDGSGISRDTIDMVLTGICESFDIDHSQKYCLRAADDLGDIYRAMTQGKWCDDLEYERLYQKIEEWISPFTYAALAKDINFTVEQVIFFIANRKATQSNGL